MNLSLLLFGILPLIAFVVIDSISGVKAGVIAAILLAIAEAIYTLVVYHTIDGITLGSTALVVIFGAWSLRANDPLYMKLQPVFLGTIFGSILVITGLMDQPLLVTMINKYDVMLPEEIRRAVSSTLFQQVLARLSDVLGIGFLIHAGLVFVAARYLNKWWWLIIRGVGFYLMLAACAFYVRITM